MVLPRNKNRNLLTMTNGIIIWFLVMLFGPYLRWSIVPVRLDHVIFPTLGCGIILYAWWRYRRFAIPKLLYPLIGFMAVSAIATVIAVYSGPFYIRTMPFLAGIENHVRILLIFLIVASFPRQSSIDLTRILHVLFLAAVILGIFGIMQTLWNVLWIKDVSVYLYEGRHDGPIGITELCIRTRAVSTFYGPSNFGLFSALVTIFAILGKDHFKFPKAIYLSGLFIIVFAGIQTMSKSYLGAVAGFVVYLLIRKRLRVALLVLVLFSSSLYITLYVNPYGGNAYLTILAKVVDPFALYNETLGKRYGILTLSEDGKGQEEDAIVIFEEDGAIKKAILVIGRYLNLKALLEYIENVISPIVKYFGDEGGAIRQKNVVVQKVDTAVEKPIFVAYDLGYLNSSAEVIMDHPVFGVGYVSNVNSGDSMLVHLLVRGGVVGCLYFLIFIILLVRRVGLVGEVIRGDTKWICEAWMVTASIFLIGGIGLPTFIQDRTGDIFWWLGALLAYDVCSTTVAKDKSIGEV